MRVSSKISDTGAQKSEAARRLFTHVCGHPHMAISAKKSSTKKSRSSRRLSILLAAFVLTACVTACAAADPGNTYTQETAVPAENAQPGDAAAPAGSVQAGEAGSFPTALQPGEYESSPTALQPEGSAASGEGGQTAGQDPSEKEGHNSSPQAASPEDGLPQTGIPAGFKRASVPEYRALSWADVNGDVPFFTSPEMEAACRVIEAGGTFQQYGELDEIGRCTGACALVGPETLPSEGREDIRMIKPAGWHTVKYDGIDGNYLYNRCHLIGFQLTGQNANEKNLITGTRFLNIEGMLPFEDSVLAYVQGTGKHVLYRVTPVYATQNLLADGVLMEARSVEDPLVQFCAFCYNVQPDVVIDYATGDSEGPAFTGAAGSADAKAQGKNAQEDLRDTAAKKHWDYIVNVRTGIFHFPFCASAEQISSRNRQGFTGTREELIEMGYQPCGYCRP